MPSSLAPLLDLATWDWEATRGWLSTGGGLVALTIATNTYRRNVKAKREEQARLVFSRVAATADQPADRVFALSARSTGEWVISADVVVRPPTVAHATVIMGEADKPLIHVVVSVHNGSKELIGPVIVMMEGDTQKQLSMDVSYQIDAILPDAQAEVQFTLARNSNPNVQSSIVFRDASGAWWNRHSAEPVKKVTKGSKNERRLVKAFGGENQKGTRVSSLKIETS